MEDRKTWPSNHRSGQNSIRNLLLHPCRLQGIDDESRQADYSIMTPAVNGNKESEEHGTLLPALIGISAEELEDGKIDYQVHYVTASVCFFVS